MASPALTPRIDLVVRARYLASLGLAWHAVEASVALIAGIAAGSIALVGFGADSLIEMLAGALLLWRFSASRAASHDAEHTTRRLIAVSFGLVAAYVAVVATLDLAGSTRPQTSVAGIVLAVVAMVAMPPLAIAKSRNARLLASPAARGEGRQTMLCAYLSVALLAGLGLNALFGWWWADPLSALGIAAVATREAWSTWRGDGSCCH